MSKNYCVYCHTNKTNGKRYIGITSNKPERRWKNGAGYVNNQYFSRAIALFGWHNFTHEVLYTGLSKEKAEELEIELIREFNSADPAYGYNIERGGSSTDRVTLETRQKISAALMGHSCSEETKKKISEANKGKISPKKGSKMSDEVIEKNRLSHIGQKPWNKGRAWTSEERAKCNGKAVYCVETEKVYLSAHEASRELGVDFSSICKAAKGRAKSAGGYHFVTAEEWRLPDG